MHGWAQGMHACISLCLSLSIYIYRERDTCLYIIYIYIYIYIYTCGICICSSFGVLVVENSGGSKSSMSGTLAEAAAAFIWLFLLFVQFRVCGTVWA